MMEMVNGSRFGVALMGLGIARRSFLEGTIWAHHRRAKGRLLVVNSQFDRRNAGEAPDLPFTVASVKRP